MHGNVAEWTRTDYRPYPYRPDDGRDDAGARGPQGRPRRLVARPALPRHVELPPGYPPYQRVYNVGFRVVCPRIPF